MFCGLSFYKDPEPEELLIFEKNFYSELQKRMASATMALPKYCLYDGIHKMEALTRAKYLKQFYKQLSVPAGTFCN